MSGAGEAGGDAAPAVSPDPLAEAMLAARLCAVDPGLGGMVLRGEDDARDAVIAALRAALGDAAPIRRVPSHIDAGRLLGGLDLGATLASGRPVAHAGLLAEADGGAIILPMAERAGDAIIAPITAVLDNGAVASEREGMALRAPARFVVVALDDATGDDAAPAPALAERLAFRCDLGGVRLPPVGDSGATAAAPVAVAAAPEAIVSALTATAAALGITSMRAPILALRAARAAAALAGRRVMIEADAVLAARLVLAPRATQLPAADDAADDPGPSAPPPPEDAEDRAEDAAADSQTLEDVVLAATLASLPKDVLARIAEGGRRGPQGRGQGKGQRQRAASRGRPVGVRNGVPRGGLRLSLIDTLRAAAPWQRLRGAAPGQVAVRRDDLRIHRFEKRREATTIFAVDASGSSAAARLAEAKGAVELLLAEAYVKRAQVALIAFRGAGAELVLPPTRSLTRARRALADLPGGGGTPLAAGLRAAGDLAQAATARGRTPFIVVLTDGRANIALDGGASRAAAEADATAAAGAIGAAGVRGAFVDISARPRPEGAALAAVMGARYLPLPRADARTMHAAVKGAQDAER